MKKILVISLLITNLFSWNGYDYDNGTDIEIGKGNLVRSGNDIEYYDYSDGEYKNAQVDSIRSYGNSVELNVIDEETGEYRTFEMER
ncbi:DUF5334 domain-containing protein [Aliarcobacter butzleri]|jgi:hypothetical protein|uniref:DUF5334 domain-containing protein n=1 Tax=Aliarcobacter butzleri TaxID=28197 RepID=UPI0021B1B89B|nr:DUF5334 domain-containing protein [Aliarcobacter butzleri]MCT7549839.1 DUF5334 domain-containing protein [Aliarcobacter butzleri]MCT7560129.1 DUF5334 domain-containing protein [Aliarcobacter butzleri]